MKFAVKIVLFLFVTFLATPTVVSMFKSEVDTSIAYSFSEEEIQKEIKEIPAVLEGVFQEPLFIQPVKDSQILSENLQKHDNVFEEIFSPPPEIV